ncbi:lipoprotein-releasing ABC transporter permease subunit [uncultured Ferrimonas sp.]|uniref:lipoprotein-releasing ABC transporter permease subunit n=1 Tax=uncultured Ferrimonas sp. TaxID=432640 RepID=UPI00262A1E4D|nr:lipoprotein-releasing ABC transporter permease subunit [uncultured Ferrimonas sp.]
MISPVALNIGLRYWRARKDTRFVSFITLFSVLGITIGVAALIIVSSVMNGLEDRLKGQILGSVPQITLSTVAQTPIPTLPPSALIKAQVPMLTSEALLSQGSSMAGAQLLGIDPALEQTVSPLASAMLQGQLSHLQAGKYRIVLGSALANKLNVWSGDTVRVMTAGGARYTPMGRVPGQRLFTVAAVFELGAEVDQAMALIHISDAKRLLRQPAQSRLYLYDAFTAPQLSAELSQQYPQLQVEDWRARYGQLFAAVKMEKRMMSLLLGLIIAVAAFNIVSALVMMVTDKTADMAILKTQGFGRGAIMQVFSVQGMSSAALGTGIGAAIGLLLAWDLQPILTALGIWLLPPGQPLPVLIDYRQVALVVMGALALSFLATLYPAWRASHVNPAEVLRHE